MRDDNRNPYSWPTCELCGKRTEDVIDTAMGVYCERCFDNRRQADADRAYDEWRDRQMEDAR